MALVSISVRTVQQALSEASATTPIIPSPGAVDGVWGSRTHVSLDIYRSVIQGNRRIEAQLNAIPARVVAILVEDWLATSLRADARVYTQHPPGVEVTREIANRVSTMGQETQTTMQFPPGSSLPAAAAIRAPTGRGSAVLPLLLGLGAAVVLLGGGYWLYTRRGRGRRR